jgi:uncharacterized membrane protein
MMYFAIWMNLPAGRHTRKGMTVMTNSSRILTQDQDEALNLVGILSCAAGVIVVGALLFWLAITPLSQINMPGYFFLAGLGFVFLFLLAYFVSKRVDRFHRIDRGLLVTAAISAVPTLIAFFFLLRSFHR